MSTSTSHFIPIYRLTAPAVPVQAVRKYREAKENGHVKQLFEDPYPARHNSGAKCKLTTAIARALHRINLEWSGGLSYAQLRDKLHQEGYGDFHEDTVRRWYVALGVKVLRLYLRPKLKDHHKLDRLTWCLNEVTTGTNEFGGNYDTVHVDEAWHFILVYGAGSRI